ncbi:MAG: cysteine desulfurase [Candidatus Marinimicrobia bacterium]|nr:cysteine desulfurase [Candidatus Neomarinimicrobiota bacterium]MCF7851452.1 cysteine desulfurase [Candidatus Neomarinimicrobiota bacterium]MCF7904107.1 cysteine desulfurase [Candidatus Neomarinimicrobiota bacterium]
MSTRSTIYLDHAAGTDILPEIKSQLAEWVHEFSGNPSGIHGVGRRAASLLDDARSGFAQVIGAKGNEILFTSGGTEANNLALLGLASASQNQGKHIISCATEHPSTLEALKHLEGEGFNISYLPVNANGDIDLNELSSLITAETILISIMWVNNETGLVHPIPEIAQIAHSQGVLLHSDAVQALGHIPIRVDEIPVDVLSFSGHKLGAPSGIGCLYLRKGTTLEHRSYGGSQENNLRAGTQNLLGVRALALAAKHQTENLENNTHHYNMLVDHAIKRLSQIPGTQINRSGAAYSPHILNCSIRGVDGEALFIRLDLANICVSNGSACSSGSQAPSHVLTAMGIDKALAQASLRISFGLRTTREEVDVFCDELAHIITSLEG